MRESKAKCEIFFPPAGCHDFPCPDCHGQYVHPDIQRLGKQQYAGQLTDDEAKAELDEVLHGIKEIRESLKTGLDLYGDLILAKWTKKTVAKRVLSLKSTTLLRDVPEKLDAATAASTDKFLAFEGYIWPYARWLRIKSFSEDRMRLLTLLHLRTSLPASEFAIMDSRELRVVFAAKPRNIKVELFYNKHCVSLLGENYGDLVEYDSALSHSWAIAGFPRALMLLRTQHIIMSFLAEMMLDLIHENGLEGNKKWSEMVASGFRRSGSEALWSSYTTPAFALPKHFEPRLLLDMAQSRLRLLLDEFWLMQTDAAYMHLVIRVRKASMAFDEGVSQEVRWTQLATGFVQEMYQRLQFWYIIVRECQAVCRAYDDNPVQRGGIQGHEAEKTMCVIIDDLQGRMRLLSHMLDPLLPTMRLLKSRFVTYSKGEENVGHREKPATDPTDNAERMSRAIQKFQENVQAQPGEAIVAWAFDLLEREIVRQGQSYDADERLFGYLTDIATMDEMLGMCYHNQHGHTSRSIPTDNTPQQEQAYQVQRWTKGSIKCRENWTKGLGHMMKSFHDSPWPKGRKDVGWWEKASRSRAKLAMFWQFFRDELKFGQDASEMDPKRSALKLIVFDTEPEYLAELQREKELCESNSRTSAQRSPLHPAAASHIPQTVWGSSSDEQGIVRHKKTKAKALRQAPLEVQDQTDESSTPATSSEDTDSADDMPIPVKQDSLSVFGKMYPVDGIASGSVRWQQFAQAMVDAGCIATESAGSAVLFATENGSISVHKRHPDPTVDPIMLQAIGKRAKKWLGWRGERFVLRAKGVSNKE
ncbi:uncharacterized protein RCC_06468 [Ramularia collo-cygni]|uniref:Uncharacterized protein n=1 Tax=Ramularia collo-cygni TaxID=112498 RepID=A0A2D3V583_9PEZI|nr:uncharacterized protein RCC_06468 [Ramularia collo-cygni]CZT20610.1 uncharacterized protein RCC_06468 [Ramularia collo-cygni]